jgi:hypothetical protein
VGETLAYYAFWLFVFIAIVACIGLAGALLEQLITFCQDEEDDNGSTGSD